MVCLPSFDDFRDLGPSVAQGLMRLNELHLLIVRPLFLVYGGVQMVVPSLIRKCKISRIYLIGD
jgi:hypothetical protein